MKIVFFGTPRLAQIVFEKLLNSPFKPQLVITGTDTKVGRGQKFQPSPVKQAAIKNHLKVLQPKNLSDANLNRQLAGSNFKADLAILVAYGKIIPRDILSIPKYGFINVHPSLLPQYRGPSPIQSAILAGEEKTGVTIIKLDEVVDHGPILAQEEIAIGGNDHYQTLVEKLGNLGAELLIKTLAEYPEGSLKPKPQNHTKATFTKIIKRVDGKIDPENPPGQQTFNRMVRAFHPWPGVWTKTKLKGKETIIKFLPSNLIQPEGKRPMTIKEFLNGYSETKELIDKLPLG